MKKIIEEVSGEGLEALLGQNVFLLCFRYIYAGKLIGVSDSAALLGDPKIVYETGPWPAKTWQDAQDLPSPFYVDRKAIESFGVSGR